MQAKALAIASAAAAVCARNPLVWVTGYLGGERKPATLDSLYEVEGVPYARCLDENGRPFGVERSRITAREPDAPPEPPPAGPPERSFLVSWTVDVEAIDHTQAAFKARAMQVRDGTTAVVFGVLDKASDPPRAATVDLHEVFEEGARVIIDGDHVCTLESFIHANEAMHPEEMVEVLAALARGEAYQGGGGAEGEWTVAPFVGGA